MYYHSALTMEHNMVCHIQLSSQKPIHFAFLVGIFSTNMQLP